MSDTKALIKYVRDRLNDGPNITFGKPTVLDLVDALEQAEAENARLTKMVDWLVDKLGFNAGQPYYDECPRLCAIGKRECLESDGTVCFDYGPCWKARAIKEVIVCQK